MGNRLVAQDGVATAGGFATENRQPARDKPGKRGMLLKIIVVVALLAAGLFVLSACSNKPFDTVKKFADAYNDLDYNKLIECYDPRITQTITGVTEGLSDFLGVPSTDGDSAAAASSLVGDLMSGYAQDYWDERDYSARMSVKEVSTEMTGDDKAKVTVQFTVETSNGDREVWQQVLNMVKTDGTWYITLGWDDLGSLLGF
jgi:hypothetical protein